MITIVLLTMSCVLLLCWVCRTEYRLYTLEKELSDTQETVNILLTAQAKSNIKEQLPDNVEVYTFEEFDRMFRPHLWRS